VSVSSYPSAPLHAMEIRVDARTGEVMRMKEGIWCGALMWE
jgi:hypothetical protein